MCVCVAQKGERHGTLVHENVPKLATYAKTLHTTFWVCEQIASVFRSKNICTVYTSVNKRRPFLIHSHWDINHDRPGVIPRKMV